MKNDAAEHKDLEQEPLNAEAEMISIPRLRTKFAWTMLGSIVVALMLLGALNWKHGEWMWQPNEYYIAETFDGLKNYNTFSYDVAHDSSYVRYEGMNYPFGEHELFTDNQPILSNVCQFWSKNVQDLSGWTIGIMNLFQLFSAVFGALMFFWLLRRLDIPVWYAALVAVGVNLLSPQYLRFDGHFGLSHTWIIPMMLLLLSWYEEKNSRRYFSLWMGIFVTLIGMLHFYNFGMAALFLSCYIGLSILSDFRGKNIFARINHLLVMVVVPFFLLNVWISWDAYATDRPANPFGFLVYIGQWEAVFLPYTDFPLYHWIDTNITKIRALNTNESKSYVGVVSTLFSLYLLLTGFYFLRKKEKFVQVLRVDHSVYLKRILATGIVILLFACGFPFYIKGMEWMIEYFGPVRQFRGLGRFSWPFYYVINAVAFFGLYHLGKSRKHPLLKWMLWAIPLLILGYEAYFFQQSIEVHPSKNLHKRAYFEAELKENAWLDKVDYSNYQAILPLPYYNIGSENIWLEPDWSLFRKVKLTSFHSGLPDMGVMMSRTPISQMTKSVQLALRPCQVPEILSWLPNRKPLLITFQEEQKEEVYQKYQYLLKHATPVFSNPLIHFMSLDADSIRLSVLEERKTVEKIWEERVVHRLDGGFYSTMNYQDFFYNGYEKDTSTIRFRGNGAKKAQLIDSTVICNQTFPSGDYIVSYWAYMNLDNGVSSNIHVEEYSKTEGVLRQKREEGARFHIKSIVNGWALFELPITVHEDQNLLNIYLKTKEGKIDFYFDEVMVRPMHTQVLKREGTWISHNGYWFE